MDKYKLLIDTLEAITDKVNELADAGKFGDKFSSEQAYKIFKENATDEEMNLVDQTIDAFMYKEPDRNCRFEVTMHGISHVDDGEYKISDEKYTYNNKIAFMFESACCSIREQQINSDMYSPDSMHMCIDPTNLSKGFVDIVDVFDGWTTSTEDEDEYIFNTICHTCSNDHNDNTKWLVYLLFPDVELLTHDYSTYNVDEIGLNFRSLYGKYGCNEEVSIEITDVKMY